MGPGRGAQRRRFGEPGLSSAASNSMGRFNVAPHAIPRRGQGPDADAATTAARTQLLSYGSQAKPAPMAPPAPGSRIGPASCDVTGARHRPAERGVSRKRASPGGPQAWARPEAPPVEEVGRSGHRAWSPSNTGKAPAPAPPRAPPSLARLGWLRRSFALARQGPGGGAGGEWERPRETRGSRWPRDLLLGSLVPDKRGDSQGLSRAFRRVPRNLHKHSRVI